MWAIVLQHVIVAVLLGVAVYTDFRDRKIYNWLTLPGMLLGALIHLLVVGKASALADSACGLFLGMAIFIVPFSFGGLGGGDLKLLGMLGSFVGFFGVLSVGLWSAIAGGLLSLLQLVRYPQEARSVYEYFIAWVRALLFSLPRPRAPKVTAQKTFPYSSAIVCGYVLSQFFH